MNPYAQVFGYMEERMMEYKFGYHHMVLLNWFDKFRSTGHMVAKQRDADKREYYWILYSKALSDHPVLSNVRNVSRYFQELCGEGPKQRVEGLTYPLKKWVVRDGTGTRTYFRFDERGVRYLRGITEEQATNKPTKEDEVDIESTERSDSASAVVVPVASTALLFGGPSLVERHNSPQKQKAKQPRINDISPRSRELLTELLSEGSPFSHRINDPGTTASKTLLSIEAIWKSMIAGKFTDKYKLDPTWSRTVNLDILEDFEDDWNEMSEKMLQAARAFREWKETRLDMNLTKSLSEFLYNPRTRKSLFLTCLSRPHEANGFAAEKVLNTIHELDPRTVKSITNILIERPVWNKYVTCVAMKSVWDHLRRHWYELKQINGSAWHYSCAAELIANYGVFLLKTNNANPNYMAYGRYLWNDFVEDFYAEKEVDLDPESIQKKVSATA